MQYHHSKAMGRSLLGILRAYFLKSLPHFSKYCLVHLNLTLKSWKHLNILWFFCMIEQVTFYCTARKETFTQKGRNIKNISPTQDALTENAKRVTYQGGFCWGQSLVAQPVLSLPGDWGWVWGTGRKWMQHWTTLPEARGKMGCIVGKCICLNASLKCSYLCKLCLRDCSL